MLHLVLAAMAGLPGLQPADGPLYRVETVQAAPGRLLDLIELTRERFQVLEAAGDASPFWMRHSQGDRWDLLVVYPMGSGFADFYTPDRVDRRRQVRSARGRSGEELDLEIAAATAWREEVFVRGPELDVVRDHFAGAAFFHVEMFVALAGKRAALVEERHMENAYLDGIGLPRNLIFVREAGAAWDSFTIGFYRDLSHYAESAVVPEGAREEAARAAGFEGADRIGSYLRSLIAWHHDTLAVAIP